MNVGSRSVAESMMCNIVARNITQPIHVIAREVYTAHVKPLEDALVKSEADKATLVEALEDMRLRDAVRRGVRFRPLRAHAHKEPRT